MPTARTRWIPFPMPLVLMVGLVAGCQRADSPDRQADVPDSPSWFEDVTEQRGLNFVHDVGPVGDYFMPQLMGSGAALFDFNKDGRLDLYLLQAGGPHSASVNRLYQQMPDCSFRDVSQGSGLDIAGYNMGVAIGDVNNDGWADVLVTQYGGVKLFLNNGDGCFTDATERAGLRNPGWGTSAAFFDYDRDGWLDLVIVNYLDYDPTRSCKGPLVRNDFCAPKNFPGSISRLFHNRGGQLNNLANGQCQLTGGGGNLPADTGRSPKKFGSWKGFEEVTETSGLGRLPDPGLGVVCVDFDSDGWPDILIANDGSANHLWMNQKNGTFREEAVMRGVAYNDMGKTQAGMGIAVGDVNGDGLLDLFITHLYEEGNTLWRQGPPGRFRDLASQAGFMRLPMRGTGFGTVFADFDHDGLLDLAVVNGRVSAGPHVSDQSLGPFWSAYGERNQLCRGVGQGRFEHISVQNEPLCGYLNVGRGLVRGDIDGDGAIDLLVTSIAGPVRLFRNIAPHRGHWLHVRAFDPVLCRDALGALVRVRTGDQTRICLLHPAESYLCSSEPRAHFGLGEVNRVDAIEVVWPDGCQEIFDQNGQGYPADQRLELRKGTGRTAARIP